MPACSGLELGSRKQGERTRSRVERVPVYRALEDAMPATHLGLARGRLTADPEGLKHWVYADGTCPITWRQGIKHDAAAVMELHQDIDQVSFPRNCAGALVDIEPEHIYPLLKGADLARHELPAASHRRLIVTQARIGQDTRPLERSAPRLWAYLTDHSERLARRKSSIYRGAPPFAIFGVGPYTFAPYKVAVSGLHKVPKFHAIGPDPVSGRPYVFDDTSYFVACGSPEQAALVQALLDEPAARGLLGCLIFEQAKRPITKRILQRLDLKAIAAHSDREKLLDRAEAVRHSLIGAGPPDEPHDWPANLETLLDPVDPNPATTG